MMCVKVKMSTLVPFFKGIWVSMWGLQIFLYFPPEGKYKNMLYAKEETTKVGVI